MFLSYPSYKFFKIDWTLDKLVLFQKMMALVLNFTSDWIFVWQNFAGMGDFGAKKLPNFYEFYPTHVKIVTVKFLNALYYVTQYGKTLRNRCWWHHLL